MLSKTRITFAKAKHLTTFNPVNHVDFPELMCALFFEVLKVDILKWVCIICNLCVT